MKIKHTPKRFEIPKNDDEVYYDNKVPVDIKSSQTNKDPWQQITDTINTDAEYINVPLYSKFRRSGRSKKGKSRRQLSPKSRLRSEKNTTEASDVTLAQVTSHQPQIFKEPVQEKQRLMVGFDRIANDTSQKDAFQELDETPWGNVSAVMLESTENHSVPLDNDLNQQEDQKEVNSTESKDDVREKFTEPHTLPLPETGYGDEFEADNRTMSSEETNGKETFNEVTCTTETGQRSEEVDVTGDKDSDSRNSTEEIDISEVSNEEQETDSWSDYVIEDPTVREYGKENVEGHQQQYYHDNVEDGRGNFEPTSEMKRLRDWFPRSRLLTTENNGYKLFPGVSTYERVDLLRQFDSSHSSK